MVDAVVVIVSVASLSLSAFCLLATVGIGRRLADVEAHSSSWHQLGISTGSKLPEELAGKLHRELGMESERGRMLLTVVSSACGPCSMLVDSINQMHESGRLEGVRWVVAERLDDGHHSLRDKATLELAWVQLEPKLMGELRAPGTPYSLVLQDGRVIASEMGTYVDHLVDQAREQVATR